MPVIPFPSERVFNSATFMLRDIVLSIARHFWKLHFYYYYFPSHSKTTLCMHIIPFPSERVFNSATFMCRYIVLSNARNFSNLHFNFFNFLIFHLIKKNPVCMLVIPFPSERVFNSATFTCRYIVLSTARNVSNLHLKFSFFIYFPSHSKTTLRVCL